MLFPSLPNHISQLCCTHRFVDKFLRKKSISLVDHKHTFVSVQFFFKCHKPIFCCYLSTGKNVIIFSKENFQRRIICWNQVYAWPCTCMTYESTEQGVWLSKSSPPSPSTTVTLCPKSPLACTTRILGTLRNKFYAGFKEEWATLPHTPFSLMPQY